mgnify:CR=1 FL=1
MNMCGLHTKTIFNTKFLDIPEFCVSTHTLSLSKDLQSYNYNAIALTHARLRGLHLFQGRGSPRGVLL